MAMNYSVEALFTYADYICVAVKGGYSIPIEDAGLIKRHEWYCGYVGIPYNHKCYDLHYDDIPVQAHGGLTYGSKALGQIITLFQNDIRRADWMKPHVEELLKRIEQDDLYFIGFDCNHIFDRPDIQNLDYVMEECFFMAEQLRHLRANLQENVNLEDCRCIAKMAIETAKEMKIWP